MFPFLTAPVVMLCLLAAAAAAVGEASQQREEACGAPKEERTAVTVARAWHGSMTQLGAVIGTSAAAAAAAAAAAQSSGADLQKRISRVVSSSSRSADSCQTGLGRKV
jgi:hypothetical protein